MTAYHSKRGPVRECHDGPDKPIRDRAWTEGQIADMHREVFDRWAKDNFLDTHWQAPIPPMINEWHYSDNRTMQLYMAWCAAMHYRNKQDKPHDQD